MNWEMIKLGIRDKIDNASLLLPNMNNEAELKSLLNQMMEELCLHTEKAVDAIEAKAIRSYCPARLSGIHDFQIVTALAGKEEEKKLSGLSPMPSSEPKPKDLVFVDADHDEMRSLVGDTETDKQFDGEYDVDGKMVTFKYRLKFFRGYLWAQDLLYRMDEICHMENAVMFSPYVRKAFVPLAVEELPEKAKPNWRYEENGIPDIKDASLLWNLKIRETDLLAPEASTPFGDIVKYKYHFDSRRGAKLICVLPKQDTTVVFEHVANDDGIDILIDRDLESFHVIEYSDVDFNIGITREIEKANRLHTNKLNHSPFADRRIISKSDLAHAIHVMDGINGIGCAVQEGENTDFPNVCTRYAAKYREKTSTLVGHKPTATIRVCFSSNGHTRSFADHMNYVLLYLEHYYPEIGWVGCY